VHLVGQKISMKIQNSSNKEIKCDSVSYQYTHLAQALSERVCECLSVWHRITALTLPLLINKLVGVLANWVFTTG